jgi:hypothetical protein
MKKGSIFVLISALMLISLVGFVSANVLSDTLDSIGIGLKPLLNLAVGDVGTGDSVDNIFIAKIILIALLISVIYVVLDRIPLFSDSPYVLWTVAVAISVLGVRFIKPEMVNTIMLSNSAVAVSITAGLSFAVYFFFVETGLGGPAHPTLRRISWIFFAVVFLGLWFSRMNEMGNFLWIYPVTAGLAFLMAVMDGTIQKFFADVQMDKASAAGKNAGLISLQTQLVQVHNNYSMLGNGYTGSSPAGSGLSGTAAYQADVKDIKKRISALMRA